MSSLGGPTLIKKKKKKNHASQQQQHEQQQQKEHQQQQHNPFSVSGPVISVGTNSKKRQHSGFQDPVPKDIRLTEELNLRTDLVEGQFGIQNQGHMREEIEISLLTLNGNKFIGTITPQEAKFNIYRDTLLFSNFSNFDWVRFAFRGVPVVVFKLKTAIQND